VFLAPHDTRFISGEIVHANARGAGATAPRSKA
jgi:hypothetical protein